MDSIQTKPGHPYQLGATLTDEGVNFALFSKNAKAITLHLFLKSEDSIPTSSFVLDPKINRTGGVWHIWIPGIQKGQLYGYCADGPYLPLEGHRFNPNKLLIDPYARGIEGGWDLGDRAVYGYEKEHSLEDLSFSSLQGWGKCAKSLVVDRAAYGASAESQGGVAGNLLDEEGFTAFAQGLGINPDTTVVVYDNRTSSTRLWWAFTYYGHGNVRVLDGGLDAWRSAGYPVEILPASPRGQGSWVAEITYPNLRVRTPEIVGLAQNDQAQLWDTRERDEFTGETQLRGASRAGRIPGAEFNWWGDFKNPDNLAEWKDYASVQALLADLGYQQDKDQYFYCQSGVRSTHGVFALYLAGWDLNRLHNYDDSWIGYSQATELPLVTGEVN